MQVNKVVKSNPVETEAPRLRCTMTDIARIRDQFIQRNLLLSFEEAGAILGKSARTVQELVKDGKLQAADERAIKPGRKGATATAGTRVTAESVENYRRSILVPPEKWGE